MTHSWAVLVILLVGFTLAHLGFFEASAKPRFEGLRAAGIQPISGEVHLYSDGMLVLTVQNTRPYTMRHQWVEIAPISDPGDRIRTPLGALLGQGETGLYTINASNLAGSISASILLTTDGEAKTTYTDFLYSHAETHFIPGGNPQTKTFIDGKAIQIITYSTPSPGGITTTTALGSLDCTIHRNCACDMPQGFDCQVCHIGFWDNYWSCSNPEGNDICWSGWPPEGACVWDGSIDCGTTGYCPLDCQECQEGMCASTCEGDGECKWRVDYPDGACDGAIIKG